MTHVDNIPHILEYGITHINSPNSNPDYIGIGDSSLIDRRSSFELNNGRKLGEYIPFYFWYRMPMLFVIQKGYNGVKATLPKDIVYCVSTIQMILSLSHDFVFTDGHAVNGLTMQYGPEELNNIDEVLKWEAIKAKFWVDENNLDVKRRKEAEFLLDGDLEKEAILGYLVYDDDVKQKLIAWGIDEKLVHIGKHYYF
jgi:hypothetical protein